MRSIDGLEWNFTVKTPSEREKWMECFWFVKYGLDRVSTLSERETKRIQPVDVRASTVPLAEPIKILVGTWNMGDAPPKFLDDPIETWLPPGYDIYCISTQVQHPTTEAMLLTRFGYTLFPSSLALHLCNCDRGETDSILIWLRIHSFSQLHCFVLVPITNLLFSFTLLFLKYLFPCRNVTTLLVPVTPTSKPISINGFPTIWARNTWSWPPLIC